MLPSPPGAQMSLAPPSPPTLDLEPSPSYSPLSTPSQSPRPPPSPPLAPVNDTHKLREERDREREIRELKEEVQSLKKKEKERATAAAVAAAPAPAPALPTVTPVTATTTSLTDLSGLSPDSIALRSTLRLLILQRDRAKGEILDLEKMREDALKEPLQFVEFIQSQKTQRGRGNSTSADNKDGASKKPNIFAGRELPKPQEIYRCPPIEWSQYKILGAPLDALHDKQRRRASPSRPSMGSGQGAAAGVPPSMQTGGIIGMPPTEYGEDSGMMQGRMRLFDGIGQRGSVVGR